MDIYDGTNWINVMTISAGQDDNVYHPASISLAGCTLGSSFQVRFRSLMSDTSDYFYVDDLQIGM